MKTRFVMLASVTLTCASMTALGCSPEPAAVTPEASAAVAAHGSRPSFSFAGLDGRPVSSSALAQRVSVIGFLATYDVHSQAEARFLALLEKHHSPRVNVVALVLEAPENRPLAEAFVASLGITYPVALADAATIAGEGPFPGLHHVPAVVILDRTGREAFRYVGFLNEAALEQAVREVEKSSPPPSPTDG